MKQLPEGLKDVNRVLKMIAPLRDLASYIVDPSFPVSNEIKQKLSHISLSSSNLCLEVLTFADQIRAANLTSEFMEGFAPGHDSSDAKDRGFKELNNRSPRDFLLDLGSAIRSIDPAWLCKQFLKTRNDTIKIFTEAELLTTNVGFIGLKKTGKDYIVSRLDNSVDGGDITQLFAGSIPGISDLLTSLVGTVPLFSNDSRTPEEFLTASLASTDAHVDEIFKRCAHLRSQGTSIVDITLSLYPKLISEFGTRAPLVSLVTRVPFNEIESTLISHARESSMEAMPLAIYRLAEALPGSVIHVDNSPTTVLNPDFIKGVSVSPHIGNGRTGVVVTGPSTALPIKKI